MNENLMMMNTYALLFESANRSEQTKFQDASDAGPKEQINVNEPEKIPMHIVLCVDTPKNKSSRTYASRRFSFSFFCHSVNRRGKSCIIFHCTVVTNCDESVVVHVHGVHDMTGENMWRRERERKKNPLERIYV